MATALTLNITGCHPPQGGD